MYLSSHVVLIEPVQHHCLRVTSDDFCDTRRIPFRISFHCRVSIVFILEKLNSNSYKILSLTQPSVGIGIGIGVSDTIFEFIWCQLKMQMLVSHITSHHNDRRLIIRFTFGKKRKTKVSPRLNWRQVILSLAITNTEFTL